jgi:hypothetical protein
MAVILLLELIPTFKQPKRNEMPTKKPTIKKPTVKTIKTSKTVKPTRKGHPKKR